MTREAVEKAIWEAAKVAGSWEGVPTTKALVAMRSLVDAVLEEAAKAVSRLSPQTNEQADMQEWAVAQIRHMKSQETAKP